MKDRTVTASELARNVSSVIDEVQHGASVTIQRHGKAVARLVPISSSGTQLLGSMAGRGRQMVSDDELLAPIPGWQAG